jgi:hypothetical protein
MGADGTVLRSDAGHAAHPRGWQHNSGLVFIALGPDSGAMSGIWCGGDLAFDRGARDVTGHLMLWSGGVGETCWEPRARRRPARGALALERGGDPLDGPSVLERDGCSPA